MKSGPVNTARLSAEDNLKLRACAARYPRYRLTAAWHIGEATLDRLLFAGVATRPVIERVALALQQDGYSLSKGNPTMTQPKATEPKTNQPAPNVVQQPHTPAQQPGVHPGQHSPQQKDAIRESEKAKPSR